MLSPTSTDFISWWHLYTILLALLCTIWWYTVYFMFLSFKLQSLVLFRACNIRSWMSLCGFCVLVEILCDIISQINVSLAVSVDISVWYSVHGAGIGISEIALNNKIIVIFIYVCLLEFVQFWFVVIRYDSFVIGLATIP